MSAAPLAPPVYDERGPKGEMFRVIPVQRPKVWVYFGVWTFAAYLDGDACV